MNSSEEAFNEINLLDILEGKPEKSGIQDSGMKVCWIYYAKIGMSNRMKNEKRSQYV